jgi:hypothetical protein
MYLYVVLTICQIYVSYCSISDIICILVLHEDLKLCLLVCLFRSAVYIITYLCIEVVGCKWGFLPKKYFETRDRKKKSVDF